MLNIDTIINQKILLQTSNHPTPHLETELEIMQRLLEQNNIIYWIICNRNFENCFHNPEHKFMHCKVCNSRVNNGLKALQDNITNHENLHILNYNQFFTLSDFKQKSDFPKSFNFQDVKSLKANFYKNYDNGMATISSLVSFTRDHEPNLSQYQDFIYRGLLTGAYLYDLFHMVIDQIDPDLVIIFNGRFIENRPLLRVCEHRNVNFATHERGGKMTSFLFCWNSIPHALEAISTDINLLWETAAADKREIGKKFFTNRITRIEDAWYSFTKNQKYGQLPESFNVNSDKKIITIFNSSLDEYEGLNGFGPKFYENDNEGIKQIATSLLDYPNIKLYLRVHPNLKGIDNSQNRFIEEEIKPLRSIEVIAAQDQADTYELIDRSDIIIVFSSTVGIESAFVNKRVILLGRAMYEDLDCVVIPKNHDELMMMLTDESYKFPKINPDAPLKFGYWYENLGIHYKYYQPKSITAGTYNGTKIKGSFFYRRLKRWAKLFS